MPDDLVFMTSTERIAWTRLQGEHRGRWRFSIRCKFFVAETPRGVRPIEVHAACTVDELGRKLARGRVESMSL